MCQKYGKVSHRTGIHFHMTKSEIDSDLIRDYFQINRKTIQKIMGRKENQYCRFDGNMRDKHSAIRITEHTLELRIFASTLNHLKLYSYLDFLEVLTRKGKLRILIKKNSYLFEPIEATVPEISYMFEIDLNELIRSVSEWQVKGGYVLIDGDNRRVKRI